MQRIGNLYPSVFAFENLLNAWKKARRGARQNLENASFGFNLESELLKLQEELREEKYQPRPYHYFRITDPKERLISVAAFRDRVVHHALVNILEPVFERSFIYHSYATRKGKGTHAAVNQSQKFLQRSFWYFKADISKYFDSVDHFILLSIIAKKIKDKRVLRLIEIIIRNSNQTGKGIPIGNLTSQFFGKKGFSVNHPDQKRKFKKNTIKDQAKGGYVCQSKDTGLQRP